MSRSEKIDRLVFLLLEHIIMGKDNSQEIEKLKCELNLNIQFLGDIK